ncbi:FecR family protein [Hephaestia sp. GCM10023244]|uniref:FecR family protein n=1 Tax=unclassified Hephaestia TaxID=2631281 RepID=UPI002076D842|nr:FecR domain-containing protein [Hephaestia sp. MAHUQ-44]MCM8732395.1 DUF4880 domain-containing protein [Hephaestia sp. MAHUQ-44]
MNAHGDGGGGEAIREQAAMWIARLGDGQPSAAVQADFEAWRMADPRHALVYRRMSMRFDNARILHASRLHGRKAKWFSRPAQLAMVGGAIAATIALIVAVPFYYGNAPDGATPSGTTEVADQVSASPIVRQQIATLDAAIRTIGLADGSTVAVDAQSLVAIDFTRAVRTVRLLRGRARFVVAHGQRPFVVEAGGGSVIARGTIFDVGVGAGDRVDVVLLRGVIDVAPGPADGALGRQVESRRLTAGQAIAFARGVIAPPPRQYAAAESEWVDQVGEFDNVTLAYVLDRANAYTARPLRVADPALGQIRISGRFRVTDPDRLATNLASLFDLQVEAGPTSVLLSRK